MMAVCNTCKHYDNESGKCTKKGIKIGNLNVCVDWSPNFSRTGAGYQMKIGAYAANEPRFLTKDELIEKEE